MKILYGEESLSYLTASAGDIIVTRATTGFHRGTPPISQERTMLTLNYVIHPEEWKPINFKVSKEQSDNTSADKLPFLDFLIKT